MEAAQRSAIRKCRVRLVNDLLIEDMFDSIESHSLFTPIMLECIKAKESRPEKVRTFLDYLQRRGPDAFDMFIQCCRESEHGHIANYVLQEYLNIQNKEAQKSSYSSGAGVSMSNNMYLTQETQGSSSQGQMETQGSSEMSSSVMETQGTTEMSSSVMETQGLSQTSSSYNETQGSSQCYPSGSAAMSQGINELDRREEEMQEDNEDTFMDEAPSSRVTESSVPGSTSTGTCSVSSEPLPSLPSGFMSSSVGPVGYTGNLKEEYKMDSDPRGFLLIINNRDFRRGLSKRDGTDIDCSRLKTLFLSLGFGVDVRNNLTALDMKNTLYMLSQHSQLNQVDSLAVALLTHGTEDVLYGVDANYINVNDAFMPFTADKCPALHHKPKLFIINACRGDAEDKGSLTYKHVDAGTTSHDVSTIPPQLFGQNESGAVTYDIQSLPPEPRSAGSRIPNMKDFLVAFSTIPGHVSWRHLNDGSFFIQGFVKVFQEYAHRSDVMSMLVKVNNEVSKNINHQGVQIPAPQVMLTKTWHLNPKT